MKNIFILFCTWNRCGDTITRKIEGVFQTLAKAQETCLENVSKDLEYAAEIAEVPDFIVIDEEKTNHNGGVLKSTDPDFRSVLLTDGKDAPEWQVEYEIEEHPLVSNAPRWDFIYDEECPDPFGYNCNGILSDGQPYHFLFFTICRDVDELTEHCSVRSNFFPIEGTQLCRFPWTDENEKILLECLNTCGENYCGDESPLHSLQFKEPESLPEFAEATIVFNDTPDKYRKVLIKLNPDIEKNDELVFFYCKNFREFLRLSEEGNGEDFQVLTWNPLYREQIKGLD